jgi:hypothetical protein
VSLEFVLCKIFNGFVSNLCIAGDTGNDVEHFMSTSVSVVFVLVGEFAAVKPIGTPMGDAERDDGNLPLSRAGKILVNVLVVTLCDNGTIGLLPVVVVVGGGGVIVAVDEE